MHGIVTDPEEEKSEFSKSFTQKHQPSDISNIGVVTKLMTEADDDDDEDDDSTLAGGGSMMQSDADLWRTAWSQGRGVLNSNRPVGLYDDEADVDPSLPAVELNTLKKRRCRVRGHE